MKPPKNYRVFDYRKSLLPNDYLAYLEEDVTDIESAKLNTGYSVGYQGWNLLCYVTLCGLDRSSENVIVETGSNIGCSTIILCQTLKDSGSSGHVYSVEIDFGNYSKAVSNLDKAGVAEYASLTLGDSLEFLTDYIAKVDTIRLVFLDGCHEQDHVVKEFELIYPKLTKESIVFFDNTYKIAEEGEEQRVNGALKIIKEKYSGNLVNLKNTSWFTPGQAIWQKDPFAKDWK